MNQIECNREKVKTMIQRGMSSACDSEQQLTVYILICHDFIAKESLYSRNCWVEELP